MTSTSTRQPGEDDLLQATRREVHKIAVGTIDYMIAHREQESALIDASWRALRSIAILTDTSPYPSEHAPDDHSGETGAA